MESISPNIFVNSMDETIAFYQQIGFAPVMTVPETGPDYVWAIVVNGNVSFILQTFTSLGEGPPKISRQNGASLLLYIKLKKYGSTLT